MHSLCVQFAAVVVLGTQCLQVMSQCGDTPFLVTQRHSISNFIQSPNYPENYTENIHCKWNIRASVESYENDFLKFEVVDFILMGNSGCTSDYLEITAETRSSDPESVVSRNVGRWCGKRYSKFLEIPGDVTFVFHSDSFSTSQGFKIKIDLIKATDICNSSVQLNTTTAVYGSHLTAVQEFGPAESLIYSPGFPFGLYREMKCVWEIGLPKAKYLYSGTLHLENMAAMLPWKHANVSNSPGSIHIMENWEGGKEYSYRIDEYFIYQSSSPYMTDKTVTVTFNRTRHSPKYHIGFQLIMYPRIPYKSSCYMDVLTADPEPSFVDIRDNGFNFIHCSWMISSGISIGGDENRVVVVEVLEMDFDWSTVTECNKIFRVEDRNHSLIFDELCKTKTSSDLPIFIRSYGVWIFVKFNINTKLRRLLFKYYSRNKYDFSEKPVEAVENRSYMWLVAPSVLKEWITEPVRWLFTTRRPGKCIELGIVNITQSKHYTDQIIRAFDGSDETADEIMTCPYIDKWGLKRLQGPVRSTGSSLFVLVNTETNPVDTPVLFSYTASDTCGTDVIGLPPARETEQTVKINITSPHKNILCRWKIASEGGHVQIRSSTQLTSCDKNVLAAYNSLSSERLIGKWCQSNDSVISEQNDLYLKLAVKESDEGNFQLKYFNVKNTSSCCSQNSVIRLTAESVLSLTSPNHPVYYPMNCDCMWHIIAAGRVNIVSIDIEEFHLQRQQPGEKCTDSLALYNGNNKIPANEIAVLCGEDGVTKNSFQSAEQNMTLHFKSDSAVANRGFRLSLKSVAIKYINTAWSSKIKVTTKAQYLHFSGSSSSCSGGVCVWTLNSPKHHVTHIQVLHLQIPCTSQFLEVVDSKWCLCLQSMICAIFLSVLKSCTEILTK